MFVDGFYRVGDGHGVILGLTFRPKMVGVRVSLVLDEAFNLRSDFLRISGILRIIPLIRFIYTLRRSDQTCLVQLAHVVGHPGYQLKHDHN